MDLPRDRIDLEMKIRSVGIERLSDQINIIDDEEKSDISVKLFGENDIGRHLSLIFNENNTLWVLLFWISWMIWKQPSASLCRIMSEV